MVYALGTRTHGPGLCFVYLADSV